MLKALHIKNIVLIEQISLDFETGLSALTGETGAGKSILLDSLGLALGARADASLVRRGTDQASVIAEFDIPQDHPVFRLLEEQGISGDGSLIFRRVLGVDGKSKAFVNDEPVSVGFLKTLGELLVDIHGQFETYGLLNSVTHRIVLDQYAHNTDLISMVSDAYSKWRDMEGDLSRLKQEAARVLENEAYLRECVEELEALDPQEGEEVDLVARKKMIQNIDALRECFAAVEEFLGGEQGADLQIGQAARLLERLSERHADQVGDDVRDVIDGLDRASSEIQEACRMIEQLAGRFDPDGLNLEEIEDRLYSLRAAARKHHCSVEELAGLSISLKDKTNLLDHQSDLIGKMERQVEELKENYRVCAQQLHDARKKSAHQIEKKVNSELKPLKLDKSVFETSVELCHSENAWGAHGFDDVRFLVATNASSDTAPVLEPLNKIASGGEMARFMLALKVVLADSAPHSGVYVFDEIDTGIGGATASAVGERLAKLAARHQVMVVTHSPQVASVADHHWMVAKDLSTGGGRTTITPLSGQARQEEIARMLSGAEISTEARAAAAKLLDTG